MVLDGEVLGGGLGGLGELGEPFNGLLHLFYGKLGFGEFLGSCLEEAGRGLFRGFLPDSVGEGGGDVLEEELEVFETQFEEVVAATHLFLDQG